MVRQFLIPSHATWRMSHKEPEPSDISWERLKSNSRDSAVHGIDARRVIMGRSRWKIDVLSVVVYRGKG